MDNRLFDTSSFPYIGEKVNLSKELNESSASVVGPMLPQIELTTEKDIKDDDIENPVDEDKLLTKFDLDIDLSEVDEIDRYDIDDELLEETFKVLNINADMFFEGAEFIKNIKDKLKLNKNNDKIRNIKVMTAAKAYTNIQVMRGKVKVNLIKDPSYKDSIRHKHMVKSILKFEKEYEKLKKDLTPQEISILNKYNKNFDSEYLKMLKRQVNDAKEINKVKQTNSSSN